MPYDVIRASVHLEHSQPPAALWLAWLSPDSLPNTVAVTVDTIWRAYISCWPVEPGIHFRKETLGWTMPKFQTKDAGDRWTELTAIACRLLYLARPIFEDRPLPWLNSQQRLTPQRVQQCVYPIFSLVGSSARPPKKRGNAPGWPRGRLRTQKQRYPVVKKTPAAAKTA